MIITKDKDIICSFGDTFDCLWVVEGVILSDTITFSVKATEGSTDVLLTKPCSVSGQIITINIAADEFAALPVGDYVYDLVMITDDVKTTLLFPAIFRVKAVVHDE